MNAASVDESLRLFLSKRLDLLSLRAARQVEFLSNSRALAFVLKERERRLSRSVYSTSHGFGRSFAISDAHRLTLLYSSLRKRITSGLLKRTPLPGSFTPSRTVPGSR